eukprot:2951876-Prymnesium_polylepis.1
MLEIIDCSIEAASRSVTGADGQVQRAVLIVGGRAILTRTVLLGLSNGAIGVRAAHLTLIECVIRDCRAQSGGAILISAGSAVVVVLSNLTNNSATVSGGALQVRWPQTESAGAPRSMVCVWSLLNGKKSGMAC